MFYIDFVFDSAFEAIWPRSSRSVFQLTDVICILSTRQEKSIIIQFIPDIGKYLYLTGYSYPHHVIIVVVCPLKSLVDSHIHELRNGGISAAGLSSEDFDEYNLLKEAYAFLFRRL